MAKKFITIKHITGSTRRIEAKNLQRFVKEKWKPVDIKKKKVEPKKDGNKSNKNKGNKKLEDLDL